MRRYFLSLVLMIGLSAPVLAQEAGFDSCQQQPDIECVMSLAMAGIEEGSAFASEGNNAKALAALYLQLGKPSQAEHIALSMPPTSVRFGLMTQIALAYNELNQQNSAVRVLKGMVNSLHSSVEGARCVAHLAEQYQAAALMVYLSDGAEDAAALPSLHPSLKDAVRLVQMQVWLEAKRDDKAVAIMKAIEDATWRHRANLAMALYELRTIPAEKVVKNVMALPNVALQKEFMEYHLPMELVALDDLRAALKWAHRIENLQTKVALFNSMAEAYKQRDNLDKAGRVLSFAKDIALKIESPFDRAMALKTIAKNLVEVEHPKAARTIFGEALTHIASIEYLPKRLSGYISVIELEKHVGEEKGARIHAMRLIKDGIFKQVEAYGKPGEITRLMHALDGLVTVHDIMHSIMAIIPLEDQLLRTRLLRKVAQWGLSDRVNAPLNNVLLNKTRLAIDSHLLMFERTQMYLVVALALLQNGHDEEALNDVKNARKSLSGPIISKLPAAAINKHMARTYRQLARAELLMSGVPSARDDLREADRYLVADEHPELIIHALLDHGGVDEAVERYGLATVIEHVQTPQQVLPVVQLVESRSDTAKETLISMLVLLAKEKRWQASYEVVNALRRIDEKAFMGLGTYLKKPPQDTLPFIVSAMISVKEPDEAEILRLSEMVKDSDFRSYALLTLAKKMAGLREDAVKLEPPVLTALPDDYAYRQCKVLQ